MPRAIKLLMPFYHPPQPKHKLRSRTKRWYEDKEDAFDLISEHKQTYEACQKLINGSTSTSTSKAGKKWLDIIQTRLKWLSEDKGKIKEKLEACEREKGRLFWGTPF
jgi:hypothetical protein